MLTILKNLAYAFYSRPFYEDVVLRWKGVGFSYICILALLSILGAGIHFYPPIQKVTDDTAASLEKLPTITIKDGKVSIDKPTPFRLTLLDIEGSVFKLEIDPLYHMESVDQTARYMSKNSIFILVASDRVFTQNGHNQNDIEVRQLSKDNDNTLTHQDWSDSAKSFKKWTFPFVMLGISLVVFLGIYIAVLIMALIVQIIALVLKVRINLQDAIRIAAVSGIPAGLMAAMWLPFHLKAILWAGYGLFAIAAARNPVSKTR